MAVDRSLLEAALAGYVYQRDQIDLKVAEIRQLMGTGVKRPTGEVTKPKRGMSAAGRARVAAAQRKRWAEQKRTDASVQLKPKRFMSAAGRKRIADATRKRWAAYRAAKVVRVG